MFFGMLNLMASAIWSSLSALARSLARIGVLKRTRLGCRVISVGNIQAGGAGKTPLVALIAREAEARGLNVCILTRGYGGNWESQGGVIAPDSASPGVAECGDEAALLHDVAPKAWIGIGADRVAQFRKVQARSEKPIDLVILDDGFQHFRIERDLDIVALTSRARWQTLFRDWPGALRKAQLLVWTKGDRQPYTGNQAMVKVRYRLPDQGILGESKVWLVTGVGDSAHALDSARQAGWEIARHIHFPDHARYARPVVREMIDSARKTGCKVAITGKDWVKWRELGVLGTDVIVLEPEIVFERGRETWSRVLWGATDGEPS